MPARDDEHWIAEALKEAKLAEGEGEVPVAAIIVRNSQELIRASNRTIRDQDPTAHAETLAIREASRILKQWRLEGCTLYVTLEPCAMCAGAIVLSRIERVVFAAWDDKAGMAGSVGDLLRHPKLNHRPQVQGGVNADASAELLRQFFAGKRDGKFVDTPDAVG